MANLLDKKNEHRMVRKSDDEALTKRQADSPTEMERTRERTVFVPRTDIYERADALVLIADMPGVDENTVEINVEKRVLTITGRVASEEVANHRLTYAEYEAGDFERSFMLSEEVEIDKIEASVRNGVLRLELPKSEAAQPKKISVKAG